MTGLISISEAQHRELVTGGDFVGLSGRVEDVTAYMDFGADDQAAESSAETTGSVTDDVQSDTTTTTSGTGGMDRKAAVAALGILGVAAYAKSGGGN